MTVFSELFQDTVLNDSILGTVLKGFILKVRFKRLDFRVCFKNSI